MSKTEEKPTDKNKKHITIKKINIIVETNIEGEKPFSITYDKIYNPVKNRLVSSQKKLDYPYFTFDVKYDETVLYELNKKDYGELLRAFFDMTYFTSMVKKMREKNGNVAKNPDEKTKNQIINHNIFMMLYFLFPTKYPTPNNITSSYNSKICNSKEFNVTLNRPNVQSSFFSTFFSRFKNIEQERIREYSYVNTSKGESTITQIIWLNDFLNEPRYRELVDTLIQYEEWLSNRKVTIDEDIENAQTDLFDKIKETDVRFTDEDIKNLNQQKRTNYSISTFIENIMRIITDNLYEKPDYDKSYKADERKFVDCIYDTEKYFLQQLNTELRKPWSENNKGNAIFQGTNKGEIAAEQLINYILSGNYGADLKNFTGLFGNLDNRSKDKRKRLDNTPLSIMDFVYSYGEDVYNKGIEMHKDIAVKLKNDYKVIPASSDIHIPKLGRMSSLSDNDSTCENYINNDIYNLKTKLRDEGYFDKFITELRKEVEKYNMFASNESNARFIAQYNELDNQIDKAVQQIDNIQTIVNNNNIMDEEEFKKIMNSIEYFTTFFASEQIKRNLTGISSIQIKVEKLLKMTNEIKALQLTKTFFEKSKGINLYYDKEQTKSNIELINELKKDKYFYFTNTVKFIKEKFINSNRESTNPELNKMMNTYFNNTSREFIDKIIEPAKNAINENENIGCKDYFNTLVTKTRPSNDQKDPEYEINLYMEVIVGKIDYQNQQNITCNYRDQNLIQMYNELTSSPNEFEVLKKNNTVFLSNIIDNVKKDVTNIATENKIPTESIRPAIPVTGGIRKRRTYKGRGKKIHKYTRKIH